MKRQSGWAPGRVDSEAGSEDLCLPPPPQSCFTVVLGGPQETGQLLEHKFDYIFFTGKALGWLQPPQPKREGQNSMSTYSSYLPNLNLTSQKSAHDKLLPHQALTADTHGPLPPSQVSERLAQAAEG